MKRSVRGVAAALLLTPVAGTLSAQAVSAGPRRPAGDSIFVRAIGVGRMDSILVLWRALDREPYGSPAWLGLSRKVDSLLTNMPRVFIRQSRGGGPGGSFSMSNVPRGWLGFNAQGPSLPDGDKMTYFAHPQILSVDPESPADRAGIVPGDVLVAFNGVDVIGHEFDLGRLIVPDKKVSVTIRRDGETKDFALDIVKVPQGVLSRRIAFGFSGPPRPGEGGANRVIIARGGAGSMAAGRYVIAPHSIFGADVSTVSEDLARALRIDKGVLVNELPESSPAYRSGLRVGDVIVGASGRPVATIEELQDLIVSHFGERSVLLQAMRNRKSVKVTVTW
jgi:membrane-associated protease RseP (regulator of RpoE activity)